MCNMLSQIVSPHLRPVIWFCGFQRCKMIFKHCRMRRRRFLRDPSSWCGWNDRGLTAVRMCGPQSSPSGPKITKHNVHNLWHPQIDKCHLQIGMQLTVYYIKKEPFTPTSKWHILPLLLFISLYCFGVNWLRFGDTDRRYVCPFLNKIKLYGTAAQGTTHYIKKKLNSHVSFHKSWPGFSR